MHMLSLSLLWCKFQTITLKTVGGVVGTSSTMNYVTDGHSNEWVLMWLPRISLILMSPNVTILCQTSRFLATQLEISMYLRNKSHLNTPNIGTHCVYGQTGRRTDTRTYGGWWNYMPSSTLWRGHKKKLKCLVFRPRLASFGHLVLISDSHIYPGMDSMTTIPRQFVWLQYTEVHRDVSLPPHVTNTNCSEDIEHMYSFAVKTINIVIECNENISIFTSAKHEWKFECFHYPR